MGRCIQLDIKIIGVGNNEVDDICDHLDSATGLYEGHSYSKRESALTIDTQTFNLRNSETEQEIAQGIKIAIWEITERFVPISIRMIDLDDDEPDYNGYEEEYDELMLDKH